MEARPPVALATGARRAWIGPALVAAAAALAYLPLLRALGLPGAHAFEGWLFRPSQLPPPLVIAAAGWLLWRRRTRLRAAPAGRARLAAGVLATLGASLYVWALLTRAADLLLPSLAAGGLALAAAARGRAGVRAALLPAGVLLLGVRIPTPLQDEIVWHLQLWTTSGAAWLLGALGESFVHGGAVLRDAEHSFHVIDGCSGFSGIQILLLVSLIVRELHASSGRRQWIGVLLAVPLGFGLNVVRIAYVASSHNPEALAGLEGNHTPQGVALLAAGTALLYALGLALARRPGEPGRDAVARPDRDAVARSVRPPWLPAAAGLAALAGISAVLPPFAVPPRPDAGRGIAFPEGGSGWTSERLIADPYFVGAGLPPDTVFHRRYSREDEGPLGVVELFVGTESEAVPTTSRFLSSKLERPGPDWVVEKHRRDHVWVLGRDVDVVVAVRPPHIERAVVYRWRLGDRGPWEESLRALFALESSPFRRRERRRVVQLVAFAPHDGPLVLDRARQRLDRFITAFRDDLTSL